VLKEVKDEGQKCISTRWVCILKETSDGVVPKARLVARGFEEMKTEELRCLRVSKNDHGCYMSKEMAAELHGH